MNDVKTDVNEFDEIDDVVPKVEESAGSQDDMIASGTAGTVYDWQNAPERVKAPPRIDLDGKVVIVKKADIILPDISIPWSKTKAGDKLFKPVRLILYYDIENQQENISGFRVFRRMEGNVEKYSHPTVGKDGVSQAADLFRVLAKFKKKTVEEIPLREFLATLNSGDLKVKIKKTEILNPATHEKIFKNLPVEIVP